MLTGCIVSSFSKPSEGVAINLKFIYESTCIRTTHRNSVISLLRLTKKDEELRVIREELKEKTGRWCTVVI